MIKCRIPHHGPRVFPLGQLIEDSQQVDAGEEVPPAELVTISCFLKTHVQPKVILTPDMLLHKLSFTQ